MTQMARVLLFLVCSCSYSSCAQRLYTYEITPRRAGAKLTVSEITQACQIVDAVAQSADMQRVVPQHPRVLRKYQKYSLTLVSGQVNTYVALALKSDPPVLVFAAGTDNFSAESLKLHLEHRLVERFRAAFGRDRIVRIAHEIPRPVGY
jgi:hypothetical protein